VHLKLTQRRRLAALTVAAAIGTMAVATPALAADPLPDPAQTGTIHITKLQTPVSGTAGDGTQLTPAPSNTPIAGVTFKVKQVQSIDLTTQAGWTAAAALASTYNTAAPTTGAAAEQVITGASYTLGDLGTQTTNAAGVATFGGLPLGLYLVEETGTPAGVTSSAPFLVTLPITDPKNTNQWLYDVYLYPKNAVTSVTKAVTDASAVALGDEVTYTITGDIPDSTDGSASPLTGYLISDTLVKELTYKSATVSVSGVTLAAGDYTITPTANADGTTTVDIRFTTAGLAKLGANRAETVTATITTTANATGELANTAYLYPDSASVKSYDDGVPPDDPTNPNPPVPSEPVITKWGSITVQKLGPGNQLLPGATFQVYTNATDAEAGANPVTIDGVSTWTTDSTGKTVISGLRYSAWADGAAVAPGDPGYLQYYLVETVAPAGYELQAEPIPFIVDANTTSAVSVQSVTDVPTNAGFIMPFTGGTGSAVLYGAGLIILVAVAAAGVVIYRRRAANR